MKTELILAVDVEDKEIAKQMLRPLVGKLLWVKLGLQLFVKYGPSIVNEFAAMGFKVFLDLKLHDIPNTVASAIKSLKGQPCSLLTIHTLGGAEMMKKSIETSKEILPETIVLGVTVLTSMDELQLRGIGIDVSPLQQVERLAKLAQSSGMQGLVCSPLELKTLRTFLPKEFVLVTPGIRPKTASLDDQSRIMTPEDAAGAGASYIVVGRPILKAENPIEAVLQIRRSLGHSV